MFFFYGFFFNEFDIVFFFFFFQAEDGIRDHCVTGVQTCALPILPSAREHHGNEDRLVLGTGWHACGGPRSPIDFVRRGWASRFGAAPARAAAQRARHELHPTWRRRRARDDPGPDRL